MVRVFLFFLEVHSMLDLRKLPSGQGPSKNIYFKRQGNGPNPTSYTVMKKNKLPTPCNWPMMMTRTINGQLKMRRLASLQAVIDIEAHIPTSLLLTGRHQLLPAAGEDKVANGRTHGSLLVGVNYYDRWLQYSLGPRGRLEYDAHTRGGVLFLRTNLSMARSWHDLCPPLLGDLAGIMPAHFRTYVYRRHLLGVRVDCRSREGTECKCREQATDLLPAMWITS